ncbi:ELKS/Rab6-interacting/CAST family member 1 [Triplophysa tibetana]|uniref:ELKS/Rab6-interacting/CAST family member 1 n=1 Tax=Triplophysa tibetana TaxID=1572043 RepID=A0A5A9PG20_9TELE|nr:ELKS/Rab6-interacting/CAST family member 1 [Triplophysa tibetana]
MAYRLSRPIRTPTLTQTTDIILTQWSAATGVNPAHLIPTLPCGLLMLFITVTEGDWGCREAGEKTKQKEPNHHILVREQAGNKLKNPEGQGVGTFPSERNTQNRMKLMADNYEDDHLKASDPDQTNHKPSPDQRSSISLLVLNVTQGKAFDLGMWVTLDLSIRGCSQNAFFLCCVFVVMFEFLGSLTGLVRPHSGVDVLVLRYTLAPSSVLMMPFNLGWKRSEPSFTPTPLTLGVMTPIATSPPPGAKLNPHDSFTSLLPRLICSWQCSSAHYRRVFAHITRTGSINGMPSLDSGLHATGRDVRLCARLLFEERPFRSSDPPPSRSEPRFELGFRAASGASCSAGPQESLRKEPVAARAYFNSAVFVRIHTGRAKGQFCHSGLEGFYQTALSLLLWPPVKPKAPNILRQHRLAEIQDLMEMPRRLRFPFLLSDNQIIPPLIDLNQNRSKLKLYIGHLTALCHERDPHILQDLAPPSAYHHTPQDTWEEELRKMRPEQLESELEQCERESAELQEYANSVLQQIADHCPDILEQVVNALEESC